MRPSLTIIMPAYNEVKNLRLAHETVLRVLQKAEIFNYEIIVTTGIRRDGSRDDTTDIAKRLAKEYEFTRSLYCDHFVGLGHKYHEAVQAATKDYIMLIPGDGEFIEDSIVDILGHIGEEEIIITYPDNPEVRKLKRRFISRGFTILCNILFGLNLKYYNGLNILPRKYLQEVTMECDNFAYMAEILIYLVKSGVNYIEVPFGTKPSVSSSAFNFRSVLETLGTLASLFWNIHFKRTRIKLV